MSDLHVYDIELGHNGYQNGVEGFFSGPNSVGGVSIRFRVKNNTSKTIKYVNIVFKPYNRVGDVVSSTIGGHVFAALKLTGPIGPGSNSNLIVWENAWYNPTIYSVSVEKAEIDYMDGSTSFLSSSQINNSRPSDAPSLQSVGCYIATSVYGSYDCPQVWTLRRYRDYTLAETWYGRAFIHIYYAISPTLVKWFGNTDLFKKIWRKKLDKMVASLQDKGVKSTPYNDRKW